MASHKHLPAAAFGVAILAGAGWWMWSKDAPPAPMNVVLITLDTLRADHTGPYGATDVRTPNLDRLASQGVVFDQVMTTAPLTLPAHSKAGPSRS